MEGGPLKFYEDVFSNLILVVFNMTAYFLRRLGENYITEPAKKCIKCDSNFKSQSNYGQ